MGIALVGITLAACQPAPTPWTPKPGTVEARVVMIADRVVANAYPKYDRRKYPMRLIQDGDNWVFDYALPEGMLGGGPTVVIDKKTLNIVKIYESQ